MKIQNHKDCVTWEQVKEIVIRIFFVCSLLTTVFFSYQWGYYDGTQKTIHEYDCGKPIFYSNIICQ